VPRHRPCFSMLMIFGIRDGTWLSSSMPLMGTLGVRHAGSNDPVFGFLVMLEKGRPARNEDSGSRSVRRTR
jgi:hypothetical protein